MATIRYIIKNSNGSPVCPSCGGENKDGIRDCAFCGATLVDVIKETTDETVMGPDEAIRSAPKFGQDFIRSAGQRAKEANKEFYPNGISPEQKRANMKKFENGLAVVVVALLVLGALLVGGVLIVTNLVTYGIASSGRDVSGVFTVIELIISLILGIGFIVTIVLVLLAMRKKQVTTTTLKKSCPSCGGVNPAGSTSCKFCGHSLVASEQTVSTGFADMGEKAGAAFTDAVTEKVRQVYQKENKK